MSLNFPYSPRPIEGALAIAVAVPDFYRDSFILRDTDDWNAAALVAGAPVIVSGDRTGIWVFTGDGEPVEYVGR